MDRTRASHPAPQEAPRENTSCCGGEAETTLSVNAAHPAVTDMGVEALADRLKALADPTRLRMLTLLAAQPTALCVCDITSQFDQRQPTISHHLRVLREAGLISGEKRGVWSYYWATAAGKRSLSVVQALA